MPTTSVVVCGFRRSDGLWPPSVENRDGLGSRYCGGVQEKQSRQDDDFSHHSQFIVQDAFVLVNAGAGEGDAEAGRARCQRCLGQTDTILWKLSNESGMHNVGGRTHEGVSSAISIRGDVGGRRSLN